MSDPWRIRRARLDGRQSPGNNDAMIIKLYTERGESLTRTKTSQDGTCFHFLSLSVCLSFWPLKAEGRSNDSVRRVRFFGGTRTVVFC